MPTIRSLVTGLALATLLPAAVAAQERPQFENSWFWGAKGGVMGASTNVESVAVPLAGADWLITRSRGGLYLSVEQGFFDDVRATVPDASSGTGDREVQMKNFSRASFAMMAFPGTSPFLRPYAGVGAALNLIRSAQPVGTFTTPEAEAAVEAAIEDQRTRTSLLLMGGLQAQYSRVALFGQVTWMATGSDYLFSGDDQSWILEAGLRLNVGSAIDKLR